MTRKRGVLVPATVPFWLKPASTFGLFSVTMFIERSPGFAIPSILVPLRRGADRDIGPSRLRCQPMGCGSIVRRHCTSRYLPAHLRRIPLMGQRVVSWLTPSTTMTETTSCRSLASEPDVKVSLHPAQASQRPCEGPVSSHTTCWLYDTKQKSMPISTPMGNPWTVRVR